MFDLSFGKLAILFTLCLLVLGPEKLPKLAAQLGRWTGQARAMARHFREQLEHEIASEELAKHKREFEETLTKTAAAAHETIHSIAAPIKQITHTIDHAVQQSVSTESSATTSTSSNSIANNMVDQTAPDVDVDAGAQSQAPARNDNSKTV